MNAITDFLNRTSTKKLIAVLLAVLAGLGISITVISNGGTTTVTINVKSELTPTGPTGTTAITTTQSALDAVKASDAGDHTNLGASTATGQAQLAQEAGASNAQIAAGIKQITALARTDQLPNFDVAAATSLAGCSSRFISRNYSSRNGVRPRLIFLHQTISPDSGRTGVNAITAYFNSVGPQVSSNFVMAGALDACNYIVPMTQKSWAQVGFNSLAISIEVTGTQTQGYYVKGPGRTRLVYTIARIAHVWGIPIQRASVSGCTMLKAGIMDHDQGGACAGNHNDVNPYRARIPGIIADAAKAYEKLYGGSSTASRRINYPNVPNFGPKRRKWCEHLAVVRKNAKLYGGWTAPRRNAARELKGLIGPGNSRCRFV